MSLLTAHTLTISIAAPRVVVCSYVANVENLPRWASAFCKTVRKRGERWEVESPQGWVGIEFVPANEHGVLDHVVTLSPETRVQVPMRVVDNGSGSEIIFTLFQSPGMSDEDFRRDVAMVTSDLHTLKMLLEAPQLA